MVMVGGAAAASQSHLQSASLESASVSGVLRWNNTLTSLQLGNITDAMSLQIDRGLSDGLRRAVELVCARNRELPELWVAVSRIIQRGEAPGLGSTLGVSFGFESYAVAR